MAAPLSDPFVVPVSLQERRTGPLRNVRVAVKDNVDVAGLPTGLGNPDWGESHPAAARDANVVALLRAAGAGIVGKAHTDEFAYSLAGDNAHFGPIENPAAPGHIVGGSSSGPAAAVAAGLADLGLGTDTAGSIRVPASYCGLYGLRPTWGRLPSDGVVPLAGSFDTVGLLTRDVGTMRAALAVLAPDLQRGDEIQMTPELGELTVPSLDGDLARTGVELFLSTLGLSRGRTVDVEAAVDLDWVEPFSTVQGAEFWAAHGSWISEHQPKLTPPVAERVAFAASIDQGRHAAARRRLGEVRARLRALVGDGLLALPTTPSPAPVRGRVSASLRQQTLRLTTLASIAGLPALSVPLPLSFGGAPFGVSVVGPAGAEGRMLAVAASWEATALGQRLA